MKRFAAILALVGLAGAPPATAAFEPLNLHVVGGEEAWRAAPTFELRWSNPPGVAAVHYRVLDPSDQVAVAETTLAWAATAVEYLNVPPTPGAYTAEVWLEDSAGGTGPHARAKLRFDDVPPGRLDPAPVPAWLGRGSFPLTVRLGRPRGSEPLSGIRGYAFAIDGDPEGEPCTMASICTEAETDLRAGADHDAVQFAGLPEGTSYLHAVAVSGSGVRSSVVETVALRVDETEPVVTLHGAGSGWSNRPLRLLAHATDSASGMTRTVGAPFTAIRVDGGTPVTAFGDTVETTVIASGVHTVAYYARDDAGNVNDGVTVNGRPNAEPARAVVRIDREPPAIAFAATDAHDPESIEAFVDEPRSGFDASRGAIAVRPAGSRQRFVALPTEGRGDRVRARWDSAAYPPGLYEFRATAYDLAGNTTSTLLRRNGSRMVLRSPLKTTTTLTAGLTQRTVGFGKSVFFGGRLIVGRRTALAGRTVRVVERFDFGTGERTSTAKTDRDGRFAMRLPAGPSREVLAVAAPTVTLSGASSRPARLGVIGRVSLRASTSVAAVGGRPVVFSGRVSGRPLPPDGKAVELQFRLPGQPWSEFRTVTADARGRFRYAYRFVDDDSRGVSFRFRAFAPAQAGWPYRAAGSRPVTVRGR